MKKRCEMQVYTYSEARQKLSSVLDKAESSGKVLIRRKDGRVFALVPEHTRQSPLDVPSVKARVSTRELVSIVRKERGRARRSRRRA
jgi:antitoxin (DNA-binding transcriptional repressor) of toxin-antitoxin stability system